MVIHTTKSFFRMHKNLAANTGKDVVYYTKNVLAEEEERFIYFSQTHYVSSKQPETVFQILVQGEQQLLCGIRDFLFFGHTFQACIYED